MLDIVFERFLLPIVLSPIPDYKEAKASEVVATENERKYYILL
jgi:hypothetical protein